MLAGPDGMPDRSQVVPFAQQAGEPFAIEFAAERGHAVRGPGRPDAVRRVSFPAGTTNQPPTAVAQSDATTGDRPLTVNFDGTGSSDPDAASGDVIVYEWDLDGDGAARRLDRRAAHVHVHAGGHVHGHACGSRTRRAHRTRTRSRSRSTPSRARRSTRPAASTTWGAGQSISFSGQRRGRRTAAPSPRPRSTGRWCCTTAPARTATTTRSATSRTWRRGTFTAPDHAQPGQIEVRLTATDPGGETDQKTVTLAPRTADVSLAATPAGAAVTLNGEAGHARPRLVQVVQDSTNPLSAPDVPERSATPPTVFSSWSDGQPRSRSFTATANRSFAATFVAAHAGHPDAHVRARGGCARRGSAARDQLRHREPAADRRCARRASCASRWPASPAG